MSFSEGGAGALTIHELRFDAVEEDSDSRSDGPPAVEAGADASEPTDPDGDGLYDDVTGDGETDHEVLVVFFEHLTDDAVQENHEYFDFAGNSDVGFNDVLALFEGPR